MEERTLDVTSHETALARPSAVGLPRLGLLGRAAVWEVVLVGALVLLAAAIRWPDYLYIPALTDEAEEILWSVPIARGQSLPLTNFDAYDGPLFNYLVAGLLVLFGDQVHLPRLLVLVVGSLTVAAAYLLGREWGGPLSGLLTAALLVTNPVHVLVNSHIAWSNCLTPFFTTLALWQLSRAVQRHAPRPMLAFGVLMGLALLTHPSPIMLVPAAGMYLILCAPELLRARQTWLGAALAVLICSPLIVFNLATGFESVRWAERARSGHALGRPLGPELYLSSLGGFGLLLLRSTAGAIDPRDELAEFLLDPTVVLWLALGLGSLLAMARRGNPLPLLVVIWALLLAPVWSVKTPEPIAYGRYPMPAVIAVYGAVATILVAAARTLSVRGLPGRIGAAFIGLGCLALVAQPLVELVRYYDTRPANNRALFEAVERLEVARAPSEVVVLDVNLDERRLGSGAIKLDLAFETLFVIRQIPFAKRDVEPADVEELLASHPSLLAVLDRGSIARLSNRYILTPIANITPRVGRSARQRDEVPSWNDVPVASLFRLLDPRREPERLDLRPCDDCLDPGVFRISRR